MRYFHFSVLILAAASVSFFGGCLGGDYSTKYHGVIPRDAKVTVGDTVRFIAYVTCGEPCGDGDGSYQWQKDGENLVDGWTESGTLILGSRSTNLVLQTIHTADSGTYYPILWDSARFQPAHLSVVPALP